MKFVLDTHCHSIASGHAYSSIQEMTVEAKKRGLELIGITEHGPKMPGSVDEIYFRNFRVIPREINGVEVLMGTEVNIMSHEGKLDIRPKVLEKLDIVIASLHTPCIPSGTVEENTDTFINLMKLPYIHIIGHPDNPAYPIDIEKFVMAAKEYNTLIEVNNSSLKPDSFRTGSVEVCHKLLKVCRDKGANIVMGSDSHISYDVGNFCYAWEIVKKFDFPEEMIMNTSVERLKDFLQKKKNL